MTPISPPVEYGAGSWLRHYQKGVRSESVDVPCGDCVACCRGGHKDFPGVEVGPDDEVPSERTREVDGVRYLAIRENGNCTYLEDGRCSIYSTRPVACRIYDCRLYLFLGLTPEEAKGLDAPDAAKAAMVKFRISEKEPDDAQLLACIRLIYMRLYTSGVSTTIASVVAFHPPTLKAFWAASSPEEFNVYLETLVDYMLRLHSEAKKKITKGGLRNV